MMEDTGADNLLKMFISNLTHQVFNKNYFNINGKLYEKIQGSSMRTRMAPNYDIIFMHYLETNFLSNYPKQPKIWLRFIDDILVIWKEGKLELDKFLEALNSYHPTIKFMHTIDENEIPFLDTVVYRSPTNRVHTKIFYKPTDQNVIYTTTQPTQKTKKILSLMAF